MLNLVPPLAPTISRGLVVLIIETTNYFFLIPSRHFQIKLFYHCGHMVQCQHRLVLLHFNTHNLCECLKLGREYVL